MKKLIFALIVSLTFNTIIAQKKKSTSATSTLAAYENLTAQIITEAGVKKLAVIIDNNGKKENVILKEITAKDKTEFPEDVKISSITIGGIKLYHFSYTEKTTTTIPNKTENATITTNEIWEFASTKVKIFSNTHKLINIKEKQFLDKNKTASQDVEKVRREGFEFSLTKENDIVLSSKTQSNKFRFNVTTRRFDPKK